MFRSTLVGLLCVAFSACSAACVAFNEQSATDLQGQPESNGLVVVDSDVEGISAFLGTRNAGTPVGGLLAQVDDTQQAARGVAASRLIVFSGIQPGRWQLRSIDAGWRVGANSWHNTLAVPPEALAGLSLDVRAGEPVYLGVVTVEDDHSSKNQGVRFSLEANPVAEKKAWQKLVDVYGRGNWGPALRAKL